MRILFCSDSFPGRFGVLASALASQGHEVLFASHYGRRDFAISGVHRVLLKPVREKSPLKRALTAAKQAHAAFLSLRASGFVPDAVLFSASSSIPLWVHRAFPSAQLFGYADTPPLPADGDISPLSPESETEQAAMLRLAALAHCRAVFAFSKQCLDGLPPLLRGIAKVMPSFIDSDFFSPQAAQPFTCAGKLFPQEGELVSLDIRPQNGQNSLSPRAVWELALGLLAHRPQCRLLFNCATAELREASEDFAARLPERWRSRLAVQGYRSLEGWRDMLTASALFVLPEPCLSAGGVIQPEALEAMSCGTPVASPARPDVSADSLGLALLSLPETSVEEKLSHICRHLDIIHRETSLKKDIRDGIIEVYSHTQRLPSHMDELMALCQTPNP